MLDVGDLMEIIFTFIIFYCFKFSEGSQFILLVGVLFLRHCLRHLQIFVIQCLSVFV